MTWLDTVLKVFSVITPLAVAVLAAQLWMISSQKRKVNADAGNSEASGAATLSAAALTLISPYKDQVNDLVATVKRMEEFIDLQVDWELVVVQTCRDAGGPILPPPPIRPRF
ncbi:MULTISPECIES: hypothetical protein [unclassified Rhodococcus (in: high G+C Gram-positive bacteria)]|uniref:hypothetical protein n=1 Tax=unclassified Rhodococcus (in: high G+C Gram-positive bacteria) TaxID=192944 RepID=UPI000B9A60F1|nr:MULTISPECIES: hypothetical protein [unclassified Rhodococcus (in: high G+C Gram-positive bacteria)]OZE35592.1 hypothetical protein CH259_16315 [Rhodococcus sp. 05-2254-4]OZE48021.1 hypothetical protein CH261_08910 [Rhodococcus sp. 05-2254-3]OZE49232.1 hypothetical protein CH283_16695 [Rhodococcus sp. 05-2254-2]